jgi:hypothetical protein
VLTPNTDYNVKGFAKGQGNTEYPTKDSVRGLRGVSSVYSKASFIDLKFLIGKKKSYEVGKKTLGQFALHSTSHVLSQLAKLKFNSNWFRNIRPDFQIYKGNGELDGILDERGNLISKNIEECGNAAVDVEKDDYLLDLNVAQETVSVYMYLVRLGIPLAEASYFMAQPAITEYLKKYYNILNDDKNTVSKTSAHKQAVTYLLAKYGSDKVVGGFTFKNLKENINPKTSENKFQSKVVSEFLNYLEASKILDEFMGISNFDTKASGTSFSYNVITKRKYNKFVNESNVFNRGDSIIQNVENVFSYGEEGNKKLTFLGFFFTIQSK